MTTIDPRLDRLYERLPAIYRMRDADRGYPLKAFLRVIAEQVNVVEDDITQLYENWFIETAEDWAVPYIAELIGYKPVLNAGPPGEAGSARNRVLIPRREVGRLIYSRQRKGTLALLEELARDVAGWPARAVEFFRLLGWNQNINHPHFDRHRLVDVRDGDALDLIDGPFDSTTHTVDVRRIQSHRTRGLYNIPTVGVFVWRLKSYSVTRTPAYCSEDTGPHCFTFSVLGQNAPLFVKPEPEPSPTHIAEELNLPVPIRRRPFERRTTDFYGAGKSVLIWADAWAGYDPDKPIPASAVIPADLSDWQYIPPLRHVAVDPVLGRLAFPPSQLPKKGLRVTYHYGFSGDIGGGEYHRKLLQPQASGGDAEQPEPYKLYRVGEDEDFPHLGDALRQWQQDKPERAIIELTESGVYVEPISIELGKNQSLQIRAADRVRPVIRIIDWQTDMPDALAITMNHGSRMTFDGLLITGRPLHVSGTPESRGEGDTCAAELVIRHCTLVPGWGIDCDCEPKRPAEPSLELFSVRASVLIEQSILGSIQVHHDEVANDPIPVEIRDSIVDATHGKREAIGAPGSGVAPIILTVLRCTVFGVVEIHAVQLAENSIFNDCVNVARRQIGCMRFCYVPPGCRTPRRYRCQPDGVVQAVKEKIKDPARQAAEIANEELRVRPQFNGINYGGPAYAQLALNCAIEIKRGADDESEMGVFHDLFQPQREANLRTRLEEYTPAGMNVGIIFAS